MTMTLVSTVTVGVGGAASIEFTGIPQTGQDLLVVFSGRMSGGSVYDDYYIRFNSDAGANYTYRKLYGTGTSAVSIASAGNTGIRTTMNRGSSTANTFGSASIYIPNYTIAVNKSVSAESISETNATGAEADIVAGIWSSTAAITNVKLVTDDTWLQYSTASLYTISTTGATGATVA